MARKPPPSTANPEEWRQYIASLGTAPIPDTPEYRGAISRDIERATLPSGGGLTEVQQAIAAGQAAALARGIQPGAQQFGTVTQQYAQRFPSAEAPPLGYAPGYGLPPGTPPPPSVFPLSFQAPSFQPAPPTPTPLPPPPLPPGLTAGDALRIAAGQQPTGLPGVDITGATTPGGTISALALPVRKKWQGFRNSDGSVGFVEVGSAAHALLAQAGRESVGGIVESPTAPFTPPPSTPGGVPPPVQPPIPPPAPPYGQPPGAIDPATGKAVPTPAGGPPTVTAPPRGTPPPRAAGGPPSGGDLTPINPNIILPTLVDTQGNYNEPGLLAWIRTNRARYGDASSWELPQRPVFGSPTKPVLDKDGKPALDAKGNPITEPSPWWTAVSTTDAQGNTSTSFKLSPDAESLSLLWEETVRLTQEHNERIARHSQQQQFIGATPGAAPEGFIYEYNTQTNRWELKRDPEYGPGQQRVLEERLQALRLKSAGEISAAGEAGALGRTTLEVGQRERAAEEQAAVAREATAAQSQQFFLSNPFAIYLANLLQQGGGQLPPAPGAFGAFPGAPSAPGVAGGVLSPSERPEAIARGEPAGMEQVLQGFLQPKLPILSPGDYEALTPTERSFYTGIAGLRGLSPADLQYLLEQAIPTATPRPRRKPKKVRKIA